MNLQSLGGGGIVGGSGIDDRCVSRSAVVGGEVDSGRGIAFRLALSAVGGDAVTNSELSLWF